ncbi:hypothetical protein ACFUIW_12780 [Streptomyces sp. NPDC057245]|uniref:hypothetical protein n=1 Tax=Streptomyces TaxID=1883 RepID=UPI001C1E5E6C|nr:hypothetical protein [Streptomyces sp. A108]MBU6534362.1 hypothetical protein [Streptomyces sp. A108]
MTTRGRALRLTAISTLVVLSLTGFSTSRHGHGHGGDGGGGCSSSSQDHDSSSSTSGGGDAYKDDDDYYGTGRHDYDDDSYDDDDTGGGGSDSTATPQPATVELLTCATKSAPYATVEITNPNAREYTFPVTVLFKDTAGTTTADNREETTVPPGGTKKLRIPLDTTPTPDHCELDDPEPLPVP